MRRRRRRNRENDLDRELRSDLELEAREQEEQGVSAEEARYAAKQALGNIDVIKEEVREAWGWGWFDRLKQDVVYALRTFGRAPGLTAVVILTLALGIGATTTVFSIVHALLLDPLPFPHQDRLVIIFEQFTNRPNEAPFADSFRDFENWKNGSRSFERLTVATWSVGPQILTGVGPARDVLAMPVGIDFFPSLGISPEVGRIFKQDDMNDGCSVVLKHSFWKDTFGGETGAIGRQLEINNAACTVVGAMPPEFSFYPDAADMWMLITPNSAIARNPNAPIVVLGLLKPGVPIPAAQTELESLYKASPRTNLGPIGLQIKPVVYPLASQFARLTGPTLRLSVLVLFGAVSMVLLVGCLNIANLLLGKSMSRQKELTLRAALGSSRRRIVLQLLTEALLLSVLGAALGVFLVVTGVHYFRVLNPIAMPPGNPVRVNLPVLGFASLLVVITTLIFGLVPALKASRVDLMEGLRVSAQVSSFNRGARRLRRGLVTVEVAVSLALLVAAGLLIQSVERLASVPLGFRTDHVSAMQVILPRWIYSTNEQRAGFFRSALDQPVVGSSVPAAFASTLPPDGIGGVAVAIDGRSDPGAGDGPPDVLQVSISPAYFTVMGEPLKLGRLFDATDGEKTQLVAIVNEGFSRKYFPLENSIGRRIKILGTPGSEPPWLTIVGVVGDEKRQNFFHPLGWEEPPTVFRPVVQEPPARAFLIFRAEAGAVVGTTVQKRIQALGNNVAAGNLETMDERLSRTLSYPLFRAIVLTAFAVLAMFLAAIGLYAVLAQLIAQRTQEFGVRMALGARKTDLVRLVLWEGMVLTLAGLVVGLMMTLALAGLLRNLVYGLKTTDSWTLSGGSLLLLLVTLLAMYVPALRASRVDPKVALRNE